MNCESNIAKEKVGDKEILMHICCGPCAEYPLKALREEGYEVIGYFYNPNIQPQKEFDRRLENVEKLAAIHNLPFSTDGESLEEKWRSFPSKKKQDHCRVCYAMRMDMVAKKCKEEGISSFTTALTVSPYQNHEEIIRSASLAAKRYGVEFVYKDYREGFREGQEMAKVDGLYRQKYCGCIFSMGESNFKNKIAKQLDLDPKTIPERIVEE